MTRVRSLASTLIGALAMAPLYALGADQIGEDALVLGPFASVAQVGALGWLLIKGLELAKGWQAALTRREDIDARIVKALERLAECQGQRDGEE